MDNNTLSKEEFAKTVEWSTSYTRNRGGQSVSVVRTDVFGRSPIISIGIECEKFRSIIKNKNFILDNLYEMYKKIVNDKKERKN